MLPNTFCHVPGVGLKTEARIWASGVLSWEDFGRGAPPGLALGRARLIELAIEESRRHLELGPRYFAERLPSDQIWRLFPHFRHVTAYLDIETTGLDPDWGHEITTIALYDGRTVRHYVQGENLEAFEADVAAYEVLVTFNGKCFDVPFIERELRTRLDQVHIDLRYVLKRLGYSGGLKACEKRLGLDRGELDGVDGYFAVLLWEEYRRSGRREALDTLLAYNIADTVNLEALMVTAYNLHLAATPFAATHGLPAPSAPDIPFRPDPRLIAEMRDHLCAPRWG